MSIITIKVDDKGAVDVSFAGRHISKRELLRTLRAVKLGYRQSVRMYRKKLIEQKVIRQKVKDSENEDGKRETGRGKSEDSSREESVRRESISSDGANKNTNGDSKPGEAVKTE